MKRENSKFEFSFLVIKNYYALDKKRIVNE